GLVAPEDVLVLNTSRVIPARLHGMRDAGSGMRGPGGTAEILLVRELSDRTWLAMGHPGGKLKPGRRVTFGGDSAVEIVEMLGGGGDDQRAARGGRPNLGGRDHGGPHARDMRRRAGRDSRRNRRDLALHSSPVRISRRGPPAHELPPATLDAAHVGVRLRGL